MKLTLENYTPGKHRIKSYTAGSVVIGEKIFSSSLILSPDAIIDDKLPNDISHLTLDDLDQILELDPEVVVLGTGTLLSFPEQAIAAFFTSRRIGFEVMDTGAACRAYNILMADDRRVVAVLFMIEA